MKTVNINKNLFYKAVMDFCNKNSYEYNTRDVNDACFEFGIFIKFSFREEFKCEILDEHKLFLNRIKYGF